MILRKVIIAGSAVAAVLGGGAAALAAGVPNQPYAVDNACVSGSHVVEHLYGHTVTCPKGQTRLAWNQRGPQGATGKTGPQGPQGPAGAPGKDAAALGPVYTDTATTTINTGGKAYLNATELGTGLTLQPGTYLLEANFVATPNEVNAADIFPQMLVTAGGPIAAGYGTSIWNAGSGALESPDSTEVSGGDLINSNFSGSHVITVTGSPETLYFYAFGYDSDAGAGTYTLNYASVSAVQLGI